MNEINIKYDLQVIIPVYNSEKYIKACLASVLQNSKYKVLVTIINDGSTDSTGKILEDMISKIEKEETCVRLINQDNKGYSGARNTALQNIEGRYVMFVDSDDVLPENAIDKMLDVALENEADILQGNWYTFKSERKVVVNTLMSTQEYMSGYPWGKLYKYSVLEHFQFPEGYWFEDTPISFILAAMPLKIVTISDIVYGYRINPQGITATASSSKKSIDSYWVTELCLEEFSKFQLIYDQRAYEYLLKQTLMNAGRLSYYYDNDREGFYRLLNKGFQVLCFMTLPLTVGMALVAPQAVEFLYGEAFEPAVLTIRLMCPLILIKGFGDLFCYQLVYSTKSEKIILPASASASTINIITNAALIPTFLQNGAVIASVFSEFVTNAVQFIYMKKKVRFSINVKALTKGLISTIVMALSVYIIMQLKLPNIISLLSEILVGVIVYIAVNLVLKNSLILETVQKVKGKILHRN